MIYLGQPYSDPSLEIMHSRFEAGIAFVSLNARKQQVIYSPIVHFHPIACLHDLPRDIDFWWSISKDMIERCDEFWVLTLEGWENSIGILRETELAAELGKPVKIIDPA